jgi:antirestriction protein ArdC
MAKRNYNSDGQSATDKALDKFTELMIEKIEHLQGDWKKPWFTPGVAQPPHNLSGRNYNGGNALMLMMQAEKMGYEIPVWGTFDRIIGLNYSRNKEGGKTPLLDKDGNKLPTVSVNKGEKSFPVFLTTFTVVNPDTKERIPYDDYKQMSKEEQAKYNVYPKLQTFYVFNVAAQTNLKEARPELYEKLKAEVTGPAERQEGDLKSHPAIDKMIDDNLYYCPIKQIKGDEAYYSISKDEIVVPTREQFVDGEAFASNTLHECAHATGAESRLDRLKPTGFGSAEYAKEELTAELSAAVVASQYGLTKHVKNDSAAYLKSWLSSLQESPDFLKTVLNDVKRCTSMLNQRIEAIQLEMDKGEKADFGQFRSESSTKQQSDAVSQVEQQAAAKNVEQEQQRRSFSR